MDDQARRRQRNRMQKTGLILGPALFLATLLFLDLAPGNPLPTRMAAVAVLMAVWWVTDAIPLFATALLPMVLFPLLGILAGKATAPLYINSTIFLFLGGFLIALAMEKWELHRRIALFIIRRVGGGPQRLILGFMIAAAFLSMWISNTATAIMMVPIGMAIVLQMEARFGRAGHPRVHPGSDAGHRLRLQPRRHGHPGRDAAQPGLCAHLRDLVSRGRAHRLRHLVRHGAAHRHGDAGGGLAAADPGPFPAARST